MRSLRKYYSGSSLVTILILILIYIGSTMCNSSNRKSDENKKIVQGPDETYIGSEKCRSCHQTEYDNYVLTAHYNTSAWMSQQHLQNAVYQEDSFFFNNNLFVKVFKDKNGFYQTAYSRGLEAASHRMDMVLGSGKKGQTFLFANDSSYYQLPLSWSNETNGWIISPGYPKDKIMFDRLVYVKCFECHATNAEQTFNSTGRPVFDSSRIVLSISCEKCHGPGAKHVEYHTKHPSDTSQAFIINAGRLSRDLQVDACASCHSGLRETIKPAFSFLPGNKVDDFFKPAPDSNDDSRLDVHGNQYGLLAQSKCFKQSLTLNCSTCHQVHQNETNKTQVFAQRCMSCHNADSHNFCTVKNRGKDVLVKECINCHMPKQNTNQIVFFANSRGEKEVRYETIRTHLIKKTYPLSMAKAEHPLKVSIKPNKD